jgi:chemotaxis protein MotA
MDKGSTFGIIAGFGCVVAAISLHGSLTDFVDVPGALVAFGCSFAALFLAFPSRNVLGVFGVLKQVFMTRVPVAREEIERFVKLAAIARRDGLLALEKATAGTRDPFLRRGLDLVIDNTPKEKLEEVLHIEMQASSERHSIGKKIFDQLGVMLPSFGMVGTLIGLIQMLHELDDPSKIGAGMAVAMVTTFYGALGANMVFLPIAGKLEAHKKEEAKVRELIVRGLVSLLEGESPREVETKLNAYLSPKARATAQSAAKGAEAGAVEEAA